jgi:hypothetical protein
MFEQQTLGATLLNRPFHHIIEHLRVNTISHLREHLLQLVISGSMFSSSRVSTSTQTLQKVVFPLLRWSLQEVFDLNICLSFTLERV